jgi:hypothetical protein
MNAVTYTDTVSTWQLTFLNRQSDICSSKCGLTERSEGIGTRDICCEGYYCARTKCRGRVTSSCASYFRSGCRKGEKYMKNSNQVSLSETLAGVVFLLMLFFVVIYGASVLKFLFWR